MGCTRASNHQLLLPTAAAACSERASFALREAASALAALSALSLASSASAAAMAARQLLSRPAPAQCGRWRAFRASHSSVSVDSERREGEKGRESGSEESEGGRLT